LTDNIRQIFDFIIELDKLKDVLRKTKPVGINRFENSAEHSWQVCMLAQLIVCESPVKVDVVRVIEILLVHDIPEIYAGDQIVYQTKNELDVQKELQAAKRIFGLLPEPQASWCFSRWEEYETRETDEAVFAYAIDRLMPVLQNLRNGGQSWKENTVPLEKILKVNTAIGTALPSVWSYVETLIKAFHAEELING